MIRREKYTFEHRRLNPNGDGTDSVIVVVRKVYENDVLVEEYDEKILAFGRDYSLVSL